MADLQDGESVEVKGSAAKPYVLRNVGGVYSCSCPAWRNQSAPPEKRTCKHLKKLRGEAAEQERIGQALSNKPAPERGSSGDIEEATGPALLLAQSWTNDVDLAGWWMSEKLDGVRAYWDGRQFLSRQGNLFHAPDWFVSGLPEAPLDGELWLARKSFQRTVSVVRRQDKSDHWRQIAYLVFDAPRAEGGFEERLAFLDECFTEHHPPFARLHEHHRCRNLEHLQQELARVESLGGEGLMLRQPQSRYEAGRSSTLLKVKTFHDAEARVVDHLPGAGRHKGRLGALVVELADGTSFSVGTGFSDAQRESPPSVGSVITFRYQELSDRGVPRFPSFVRLSREAAATASTALEAEPPVAATGSKPGQARAEPSSVPAGSGSGKAQTTAPRYFEFTDGKSQKFWEISVSGADMTVRFGRIGTQGQTQTKPFADAAAAARQAEKLIAQKTGKGYVERESC